jgi:hypothetical protein
MFAGFAENHQIIRDADAGHCGVFLDLFMKQSERLCPLHFSNRVFPDRDAGMINKSCIIKTLPDHAAKISQADKSFFSFLYGQVHTVNGDISAGHITR